MSQQPIPPETLTMNSGVPVEDNQNCIKLAAGHGPSPAGSTVTPAQVTRQGLS